MHAELAVTIPSDKIIANLRAHGVEGPFGDRFLDQYRTGMGQFAVMKALLEAGAEPGAIHPQHWVGVELRAARILREMVAAL